MNKTVKLIGTRDKIMLCRINSLKGHFKVMMKPITEKEENNIDLYEVYNVDGDKINKTEIICYGALNLDIQEDYDFIENLHLIGDGEVDNQIPSNIDWVKGEAYTDGNVLRYASTWDVMKWFEYCYMLIGRPERLIIYKKRYVPR